MSERWIDNDTSVRFDIGLSKHVARYEAGQYLIGVQAADKRVLFWMKSQGQECKAKLG